MDIHHQHPTRGFFLFYISIHPSIHPSIPWDLETYLELRGGEVHEGKALRHGMLHLVIDDDKKRGWGEGFRLVVRGGETSRGREVR